LSTINDINQSISDMSDEQLYERMRSLRTARRVPTDIPRYAKKTKPAASLTKLVGNLTDNQLAALLAELED